MTQSSFARRPRAPRMSISNPTPKAGEAVQVKVLVQHPMETGLRKQVDGEIIPRNIITHCECRFNDELLMVWELDTAISPNPYLAFYFVPQDSGVLTMQWIDELGTEIEASLEVAVQTD